MCTRVKCPTCQGPTYAGCGKHVEQVLGDVPADQRCDCATKTRKPPTPGAKRSWFRRT